MEITIQSYTDEALKQRGYCDTMRIAINGTRRFKVSDGEPEDANLSRDFNDYWSIPEMMREAHAAGERGEDFVIKELRFDEF